MRQEPPDHVVLSNGGEHVLLFPAYLRAVALDPDRADRLAAGEDPRRVPGLRERILSPGFAVRVDPTAPTGPHELVAVVSTRPGSEPAPPGSRAPRPAAYGRWVTRVLLAFPSIRAVRLLGTEPVAVLDAVREVCRRVEELRTGGRDLELVAVTDGTSVDGETLRLFTTYGVRVVLRLDGPASTGVGPRVSRFAGVDGWVRATRALDALRQAHLPVEAEVAYGPSHRERGISVLDILSELGARGVRQVEVGPAPQVEVGPVPPTGHESLHPGHGGLHPDRTGWEDAVRDFAEAAYESTLALHARRRRRGATTHRSAAGGASSARPAVLASSLRCLEVLRSRTWELEFCRHYPASLTLDPEGCLRPCYATAGGPDSVLGHATSVDVAAEVARRAQTARLPANAKVARACGSCWNLPFCRQCLLRLALEGGSPSDPPEHLCRLTRAVTAATLLALARAGHVELR
ncbi:MAG: DUF4384 domain-containing protein [Firmicutes bacterium]|nr:DUF4384 domain-containing protein [Bacillota bacterium]